MRLESHETQQGWYMGLPQIGWDYIFKERDLRLATDAELGMSKREAIEAAAYYITSFGLSELNKLAVAPEQVMDRVLNWARFISERHEDLSAAGLPMPRTEESIRHRDEMKPDLIEELLDYFRLANFEDEGHQS